MIRIEHNGAYLYCNLSDSAADYCDYYDSAEQCLEDFREDLIAECHIAGFNDGEIERVLNHYEIALGNSAVTWQDKYK